MMRSMYSAVSGLKAHQTRMDVIGNNISNQEEIISSPYNREYYVKRVDTQNEYVQDTITKLNDSIKKAENYMREMDELLK